MGAQSFLSRQATAKATEVNGRASAGFADKLAATEALLREAAALGAEAVTQASSLGAEDVVITDIIHRLGLGIPVFVLDTGALHTETLALLERTQSLPGLSVKVYRPQLESVVHFIRSNGQDAMYRSIELRKACCGVRKMEPLARALADWTQGDVWHYIASHGVDYNPLHDQFYPSIGCAPCTRAVSLGEDFRAGRWWWESEDAKECGLHAKQHSDATSVASLAAQAASASEASAQAHADAVGVKGTQ
jgi:phosphoadenosine phosphosulfate reductase